MDPSPPPYGSHAPYGITPKVDGWITGNVPSEYLQKPAPDHLLKETKKHISKVAPTLTVAALNNAFCSRVCDDWFGLTEMTRGFGLISLPFGILGDIIKAPVYLLRAAITAVLASAGSKVAQRAAENEILERILESFSQRFEATLMILIKLKIETPETLYHQFQDGNLDHFLALTLFFTAFASRLVKDRSICLASGKILSRDQCPAVGFALFDLIYSLKIDLIFAELPANLCDAAGIVQRWLPIIVQMLKDPDSNIENRSPRLARLLHTLRQIQIEIGNLPTNESEIGRYEATPLNLALHRA